MAGAFEMVRCSHRRSADLLDVGDYGPAGIVNSVSFRVTGVVNDLGEICCGGPSLCPGATYPWFLTWWGSIRKSDDAANMKWVASTSDYLDQVIPFDQTDVAERQDGFESLSEGDVLDVELYFGQGAWLGECDLTVPPTGTMVTVTILMDVSYPLPTQAITWGRLKAFFD